jgi:hypothetical protein
MGNSFSGNVTAMGVAILLGAGVFMYTTVNNASAAARISRNVYNALPEGTGAAVLTAATVL